MRHLKCEFKASSSAHRVLIRDLGVVGVGHRDPGVVVRATDLFSAFQGYCSSPWWALLCWE